ncbi:hypothetical protein COLO4_17816 [Corchorus olitorius]|uniref:Uncharacterized protein n=1 Tax=Corchorus olitorius TaxID=93759 RepID=A0A1R3JBE5_9ROSI|nr:hypothetical protein COLO4_17816 [Corchorus olitorius]
MAAPNKLCCLFPLLCFISVFFLFSVSRKASISSSPTHFQSLRFKPITVDANATTGSDPDESPCDYSDGSWIYDPDFKFNRYSSRCQQMHKGWNCVLNKKSSAREIVKWRWKPRNCNLPPLDPLKFLQTYKDTKIGFVGDSLNRNMFISLFCILKRVSSSSKVKKWRPPGAERGFTFLHYNLTIAYHRANLLARYGRWSANGNGGKLEALGYREGYRVDVDIPDSTWEKATSFHDILIFNTGHWWWLPSIFDPVKSPMLFFEKGQPLLPPIPPDVGLDKVLKHMAFYTFSGSVETMRILAELQQIFSFVLIIISNYLESNTMLV